MRTFMISRGFAAATAATAVGRRTTRHSVKKLAADETARPYSRLAEQQLQRRYLQELHFDEVRLWPIGKSKVDIEQQQQQQQLDAGDLVHLCVGKSSSLLDVGVCMHALKYIPVASELAIPHDLRSLFDYYKKRKRPAHTTTNNIQNDEEHPSLLKIGFRDEIAIHPTKGIQIKLPKQMENDDKESNNNTKKQTSKTMDKSPRVLLVPHSDVKTYLLPQKDSIFQAIRNFHKQVRMEAMERICHLYDESAAYDNNYMGLSDEGAAMNMVWNETGGPKAEARELQDRFRISNREVWEYRNNIY